MKYRVFTLNDYVNWKVVALPLGGFLCIYGFGGGWPSIFYVFGVSGVVWFALWMLLVATSPEEHRFIGQREKDYIVEQTRESLSGKKEVYMQMHNYIRMRPYSINNFFKK